MSNVITLIFSKDRALQLRAAIESLYLHCADIETTDITVQYTTSDQRNEDQYQKLVKLFPGVKFIKETIFINQTLSLLQGYDYVLFVVDDSFFVQDFDVKYVIDSLVENTDCIGFQLRLGLNTTFCYMGNRPQKFPDDYQLLKNNVLKYKWSGAEGDFGYPLEVSESVYRTREIIPVIQNSRRKRKIIHPGVLEGNLSIGRSALNHLPYLLCFKQSVGFANPLNIVRPEKRNRCGSDPEYDAAVLADKFDAGYRVDVEKYSGYVPIGAHEDVDIIFVEEIE